MTTTWQRLPIGMLVLLSLWGCAHTISESVRQEALSGVSLQQIREKPDAYRDRVVILGGEIIQARNQPGGTLLEVLQKPLDAYEKPRLSDRTEGRFMVQCDRYLDPAVYAPGREVTVAGRVLGVRTGKVGEMDYTYPLISCLELHLWPERRPPGYAPYPWWYRDPWYWDPWYRHGWYHPFWRPYHLYW